MSPQKFESYSSLFAFVRVITYNMETPAKQTLHSRACDCHRPGMICIISKGRVVGHRCYAVFSGNMRRFNFQSTQAQPM